MSLQATEGLILAGRRASPIALLSPHTLHEVADFFPSVSTAQLSPAQPSPNQPRPVPPSHWLFLGVPVWKPHITVLLSSARILGCLC